MKRCIGCFSVFSLFCALASTVAAQELLTVPAALVAFPDLIVYNGKIVTMNDASLNNSPGKIVEAMAIRGDRIQFLGGNQEVLSYAGPQTRKIDLKGRTVVPGLIDTHNHLHNAAVSLWAKNNPGKIEAVARQFHITGKSFGDLTKGIELVVKEQMAHPLPGQWAMIDLPAESTGTGIGIEYLVNKGMSRQQLDALAPKLPVVVTAHGGGWLLNTAGRDDLLEMYEVEPNDENEKAAITTETTFVRALIAEKYFDSHLGELSDVIEDYLKQEAAGGFTTYSSHIVGLRIMPAFQKLVREDRMPIRLGFAHRFCQEFEPNMAGCFIRLGDWAGMGGKYFWNVGMTLGAIDGGPPRLCTKMEPGPNYRQPGSPWLVQECKVTPGSTYYRAIYAALRARYRFVVNHSYADKPVDAIMDIIEQVTKDDPDVSLDFIRSLRLTSDHCGFYPRPDQIPRMKKLGMMFSCNSANINRSAPWLKVFGTDKGNWIAPIKNMLEGGVMVSAEHEGGSLEGDEVATPMVNLYYYLSRKNARGEVVGPEQAIDRVSALKMSTVWAAFFVMKEKELGTLEAGKLADFVVFNKDFFTIPEADIPTVFPLMTVLGGKTMLLRAELAKELGQPVVGPQKKFRFTPKYNFGEAVRSSAD